MKQFSAISAPIENASLRVLSLGAGVQSTVMALLAARGEIAPMPDVAIFADTFWEPASVYRHLLWLERQLPFKLIITSAGDIREDVLAQRTVRAPTGKRFSSMPFFTEGGGMGRRQCTSNYKVEPIQRKIRELLGVKPRHRVPKGIFVEQWIGISTDELQRIKNAHPKWLKNRWPLIERDMSRHACLRWFGQNYPGRALVKSACIGCPYRTNSEWRTMREEDPASWADAVSFDIGIRENGTLGTMKERQYVHRSCLPLGEVDLSTPLERGQQEFGFLDECDGMLQGITGIKLQRRITRGMRQIPARRSTDGQGWEAGLRVFDRHTRITAAYYGARWNRSMPGVSHQAWGRGQIADGAFMIPGKAPAFKRTSAARFPVRVLWGPSMAREMDRNSDKVKHISRRIVKFHVLPTARRLMKVAIIEAKQRYRL